MKVLLIIILSAVELVASVHSRKMSVPLLYRYEDQFILAKNAAFAFEAALILSVDALLKEKRLEVLKLPHAINSLVKSEELSKLRCVVAPTKSNEFFCCLDDPESYIEELEESVFDSYACIIYDKNNDAILKGSDISGLYTFAPGVLVDSIEDERHLGLKYLLQMLQWNCLPSCKFEIVVYGANGFCMQDRIVTFRKHSDGSFSGSSQSNRKILKFNQLDVSHAIEFKS